MERVRGPFCSILNASLAIKGRFFVWVFFFSCLINRGEGEGGFFSSAGILN